MRAPLRFQECQREVEAWCQERHVECKVEFTDNDEEIPAFRVEQGPRQLHFRLVKGWPPIIEVRRNDFPDDEHNLRLLKVKNDNSWNPPLNKLLEPFFQAKPFSS